MKFDTTKTKGGYKILNIIGPDIEGCYGGVVESPDGDFLGCTWGRYGIERDGEEAYCLIPLDVPKPEPSDTTELWNYVHSSSKEINALRELVEGVIRRMESMQQDYIARINGLRADYLADQSTVQPSRMDGIEERLQTLEACSDETMSILQKELKIVKSRLEALEHDNKESNTWGVRVNGDLHELHNRILRLEQKTADTSDYHNLRLQIQDVEKQLEALEQDVKNSEEWGEHVNSDLSQLVLQVRALEQRSQPSEKGVWVTRESLKYAFDATQEFIMRNDRFEELVERLGLKE